MSGYCGAQDTFYVGMLKGVGRVYQQTVIDTYAKVAFAEWPSVFADANMTTALLDRLALQEPHLRLGSMARGSPAGAHSTSPRASLHRS